MIRMSPPPSIPCRLSRHLQTCRVHKFSLLFLVLLGFSAAGAEITIDFNRFALGQTPTNFTSALTGSGLPGDWKIIADAVPADFYPVMPQMTPTPSAATRQVLAQLSKDPTDEHFPMLIYDGATFKNFKATTEFKIVSGAAEQMAGIVFRYQNASNFYVVRASALGHNVRFYKVVDGLFGNILGPELKISTNVWHTLSVQCLGDQIIFWYDGQLCSSLTDTSFSEGKIGFYTKSDAVSYFANTRIEYTPIVSPAQVLVNSVMKKFPRILGLRIYLPDDQGQMRIIASTDQAEIGRLGTDAERKTYENGAIFYGHGRGTVAVDYPLNDRNGDPLATVRVELKSYKLAETQDMVLDRVRIIVNQMQPRVLSREDLVQ